MRALIAIVLAVPAVALGDAPAEVRTAPPVVDANDPFGAATPDAPMEPATDPPPPADDPPPPAPDPQLPDPGFVPDPLAIHPAGLDPVTLCAYGAPCRPDSIAAPPEVPLHASASLAAAALSYASHPARTGGAELGVRAEVWQGLAWSAHVGYTIDSIDSRTPFGAASTLYQDALIGGRIALPTERPAWVLGAVHVLSGDQTSGNGDAAFVAIGARLASLDLQLGGSAMQLDGDVGLGANLRVARSSDWLDGWLELDLERTTLGGTTLAHAGGGGGLALHRGRLGLDLEALVGDRALSVIDNGELVEAVADTFHTSGRALLRFELGPRVRPYLGVSARTATTPNAIDYSLVTGFAGLSLTF